MDILLSNEAIAVYAILGVALLAFIINKFGIKKTYVDIAIDLFQYIENNYKDLGIKGNAKLDFFLGEFISTYQNKYNANPTEEIISHVLNLVEEMVLKQHQEEGRVEE